MIARVKYVLAVVFVLLSAITGSSAAVPDSVDWHRSNLTTPVKKQGSCDSGYAFAVAAAIEGQAIKQLGQRADLSVQQIVDCSGQYGNLGCEGGSPSAAFDYVKKAGGLASFASYPYTGEVGFCYPSSPLATVTGHRTYVRLTSSKLREIVASIGPVVVQINAIPSSLNAYKGGIYRVAKCKNTRMNELNHAVTLVGYGQENGVKFWKIKNSWGPQWGEGGYFKIADDADCGVKLVVHAPGA